MSLSEKIKSRARELGFDQVGIARARRAPTAEAFHQWLARDHHGTMAWMARDPERRTDPRKILDTARSVISLGLSYYTEAPPAACWDDPLRGRVARYAWGRDYHKVIPPRLKQLAGFITAETGTLPGLRPYVDTGPVLERAVAAQAGLGFIGKNSLLISPDYGSCVFLAELIVDLELEYDRPADNDGATLAIRSREGYDKTATCGSCRRCQDACPTRAFPEPYVVDSRRCISYLTIELQEAIPEELRPLMQNWIFGCDACQTSCPWVHRFARPGQDRWLTFNPDTCAPSLLELMELDDQAFLQRFQGTPVMRPKRRGLLRNAAVALGNSGSADAVPPLKRALQDPEPLIREHAAWALDRLSGRH